MQEVVVIEKLLCVIEVLYSFLLLIHLKTLCMGKCVLYLDFLFKAIDFSVWWWWSMAGKKYNNKRREIQF